MPFPSWSRNDDDDDVFEAAAAAHQLDDEPDDAVKPLRLPLESSSTAASPVVALSSSSCSATSTPKKQQSPSVLEEQTPQNPISIPWSQAHRECCLRDGSLAVSVRSVLLGASKATTTTSLTSQQASSLIVWPSNSSNTPKEEEEAFLERLVELWKPQSSWSNGSKSHTETEASPSSISWRIASGAWNAVAWTATTAASFVSRADEDEIDGFAEPPTTSSFDGVPAAGTAGPDHATKLLEDSTATILNVELTVWALEWLQHLLPQNASTAASTIVPLQHETSPATAGLADAKSLSWSSWLRDQLTETGGSAAVNNDGDDEIAKLLPRLPLHQVRVLLETLSRSGHPVSIVERNNQTLILLGTAASGNDNVQELQVQLTLYDLERAQQQVQCRHDRAAQKATSLGQQALAAKKLGQKCRMLSYMQSRRLYLKEAENCTNMLLNLEQVQLSVQQAAQQHTVVQALGASKDALKELRLQQQQTLLGGKSAEVDDTAALVEDFMDEHVAELYHVQDVHDSLVDIAASGIAGTTDGDELLLELEQLTLLDDDNPTDGAGSSNGNRGNVVHSSNDNSVASKSTTVPATAVPTSGSATHGKDEFAVKNKRGDSPTGESVQPAATGSTPTKSTDEEKRPAATMIVS